MKTVFNCVWAFVLLICPAPVWAQQDHVALTVVVTGGEESRGQMLLFLYDSAESFLKKPSITKAQPVNSAGQAVFLLSKLRKGSYAVTVVYDEKYKYKPSNKLPELPARLTGFSNNSMTASGPPSFAAAALDLSKSKQIDIFLGRIKNG